ncbi:MAG TPA: Uma2 family endonuclease [Ktedonobacteraceae bacterium]|nr:Uma2 family endonuclease [Ktedonobacteraceae bacterium]
MARHIEDEVEYYYDSHSTEEDLMGETSFHADLVTYLMEVLRWLYHGQVYALYENLNFYQTANPKEYPLAPDIAVIKGVSRPPIRSWRVGKSGPAPQVVFEIASEETWKKDLEEKPSRYARMGVQEYFAYDPHDPPLPRSANRRLFGWRLEQDSQTMQAMPVGAAGSLWSACLESWLVPDGATLRLYDRSGQMRLTYAEAEAQRADTEARRARAAFQRAEMEARRAQALAEKLRSLGIDPDQVL